jgi:uncharacterized glyoxalase superfamily protein PhnB
MVDEQEYSCGMLRNRSVPADIVLPHIVYQDVAAAIAWLTKTFGFTEHYRYGEAPDGAQMSLGNVWIMLSRARPGRSSPTQSGCWTQSLTIFVEDVDAHFAHSQATGAKIVEELHETMYGERQYAAEDLESHLWLFSKHIRDVDPAEWGAVVATR